MQANTTSIRQRWDKAKLKKSVVFWIVIGAIVLTLFLGFHAGWLDDSGPPPRIWPQHPQTVPLVARLAPICVAQFSADSQQALKLEELKAISSSASAPKL